MSPPALSRPPSHIKAQEPRTGALAKVFPVLKHQENDLFWRDREAPHPPQLRLLDLDFIAFLPGQGDGLRWGSKDKVPSMVPHLVFLPRILLPFTWYSWSLPTTANGIISCGKRKTRLCFHPENWSGNETSEQRPRMSCFQENFMA